MFSSSIQPSVQGSFAFFHNNPGNPAVQARKMERLTTPPPSLAQFERNVVRFLQNRISPEQQLDLAPTGLLVEKIIPKAALLAILDFFENQHCLCLKVCFGLDTNLNPQLVSSGYFFAPDDQHTIEQMETPFSYRTPAGRRRGRYFLNLSRPLNPTRANQLKARFLANASHTEVHGYVMDIATYRQLLTDSAYLGAATRLRLRFGMNNTGDDPVIVAPEGFAQIMMVEIANIDGSRPFYLCSSAIHDNDDTLPQCPPLRPC